MHAPCPFCHLPEDRILEHNTTCRAFYDAYPVSRGHTLIVPRAHIASMEELTTAMWTDILDLAQRMQRRLLDQDPAIQGFNLGLNDGAAAGQTIFHLHVHLIPRREGDVPEPRGGVRWIFPEKANY